MSMYFLHTPFRTNRTPARTSVIIPTYNRLESLKKAILSVQTQTDRDWDLWVVDDHSSDDTLPYLQELLNSKTVNLNVLRSRENRGVSAARNAAIRASQSPWVAFLDSDDRWLPTKLEKQHLLASSSGALALHSDEIWIRNGARVNPMKKHKKPPTGRIFTHCLPLCCVSPSSALIHRSIFQDVGLFREDLPVCEDYDLWLRIAARYEFALLEEAQLVKYGGHADQLSRRFSGMDIFRIEALQSIEASPDLNSKERSALRSEIAQKKRVLIQGWKKHQGAQLSPQIKERIAKIVPIGNID